MPQPKRSARPYGRERWQSARRTVLRRDQFCRCNDPHPKDPEWRCCPRGCSLVSDTADHFPRERWELVADGAADPDHPSLLRGVARSCHSRLTNKFGGGGWEKT